jgi:hypothetical protein
MARPRIGRRYRKVLLFPDTERLDARTMTSITDA